VLGEGGSNRRKQTEDGSNEDSSLTANEVVDWVRQPASAVVLKKMIKNWLLDKGQRKGVSLTEDR
jgi:hypothetical protein